MKIHRFLRFMPQKTLHTWIILNFFDEKKEIHIDERTMYKLFGFRFSYDFHPVDGFTFTFRKRPDESLRYYWDIDVELAKDVQTLKVQSIESMIKQNPQQFLHGKLKFLENYSGHQKIVATKWWYYIPIGFRIIEPSHEPYVDREYFIQLFKEALSLLVDYPHAVNKDHNPSYLYNNISDDKNLYPFTTE